MDDCTRISRPFHEQLRKSQVRRGNILLARSGSFGAAAMYFGLIQLTPLTLSSLSRASIKLTLFTF